MPLSPQSPASPPVSKPPTPSAALAVLIVDDEPLARLRLRSLVQALHDTPSATGTGHTSPWVVAGEAANADQALQWLQDQAAQGGPAPAAVLLDIRMPGRSGLHLAQVLRGMQQPPAVIFVTAYGEHALKAFELEAVDYLTKPVRLERLKSALLRVEQRLVALPTDATSSAAPPLAAPVLVIPERGRVLRLPVSEILYCRAENKQVLVRTLHGAHTVDDSLSELEDRLAPLGAGFIRVHRNALVALQALRELQLRSGRLTGDDSQTPGPSEGWAVRVAPLDEWLAVSRRQVAAVKAALAGLAV